QVNLENCVYDAERILDEGIPWLADAVSDEFQEPCVHDLLRRVLGACSGGLILVSQNLAVGIFIGVGVMDIDWVNPDKVAWDSGHERPLGGHGPGFDVALQKVGVLPKVSRRCPIAAVGREGSGADQGGNVGGQG